MWLLARRGEGGMGFWMGSGGESHFGTPEESKPGCVYDYAAGLSCTRQIIEKGDDQSIRWDLLSQCLIFAWKRLLQRRHRTELRVLLWTPSSILIPADPL